MRGSLATLAFIVLLTTAPSAAAGNSKTFLDSTGENAAAPDITSVVVSNDDAGLVTFQVNIANRPSLASDMEVDLYIDSDANASTGDPNVYGAEYAIILVQGSVSLYKWNGSGYSSAPSQSSLVYSYGATGATIRVKASDLGGTKAFGFVAAAASGVSVDANGEPNYGNAAIDFAPDLGHGTFDYAVRTTLRLALTNFQTSPAAPKAGGAVAASLAATENDTGSPIVGGSVACRASVGGKRIAATSHLVTNGVATCVWRIPKTARGRRVTGTVTVSLRGATATKSFSAKVR